MNELSVSLKDYVIEEDRIVSVPLGEGIIPYQAIYKSLTNTNLIAMSYWRGTKDEGIKRAVAMIEGAKLNRMNPLAKNHLTSKK